ncbi:hypothetical protein [Streptomyces sp.]|uniref:hypothetical protein n=1 Tax=Streptomyces sp. TaxID=1931 RepID=UPI002F406BBB
MAFDPTALTPRKGPRPRTTGPGIPYDRPEDFPPPEIRAQGPEFPDPVVMLHAPRDAEELDEATAVRRASYERAVA